MHFIVFGLQFPTPRALSHYDHSISWNVWIIHFCVNAFISEILNLGNSQVKIALIFCNPKFIAKDTKPSDLVCGRSTQCLERSPAKNQFSLLLVDQNQEFAI